MARRALLVGINDYKGISDLRGCINDVTNMRDVIDLLGLYQRGYPRVNQ